MHITGVTYDDSDRDCPWLDFRDYITTVIIHDDTTVLGSQWFDSLTLVEVVLHENISVCSKNVFRNSIITTLRMPRCIDEYTWEMFGFAYIFELFIPETVTLISRTAFWGFNGNAYFESFEPPVISESSFHGTVPSSNALIYVPSGAGKTYKLADAWIEISSRIRELGVDGFPEHDYGPQEPLFSRSPTGSVYHYYQGDTARPLFVEAYTTDGGTLSYSWHDALTGSPIGVETYHFTPPTDTIGQNSYYCVVTNTRYIDDTPYSVSKTTMADTIVVVDPADTLPDDLIVPGGSGNSGGSGGSGDSGTDTPEVTIPPDISDGIGDFEDSMDNVSQFEDEAWNNIHESKDVVLDPLKTFKDNMAIVGAIGFVSDIVQKTFEKLGSWQVIITLPLAVGLILFIWSRVPGNMLPGKADGGSSRSSGKHSESRELVVSGGSRDLVE